MLKKLKNTFFWCIFNIFWRNPHKRPNCRKSGVTSQAILKWNSLNCSCQSLIAVEKNSPAKKPWVLKFSSACSDFASGRGVSEPICLLGTHDAGHVSHLSPICPPLVFRCWCLGTHGARLVPHLFPICLLLAFHVLMPWNADLSPICFPCVSHLLVFHLLMPWAAWCQTCLPCASHLSPANFPLKQMRRQKRR